MRTDPTLTAADAAIAFTDAYYLALNKNKDTIKNYYCNKETTAENSSVPRIIWNGTSFESADSIQTFFTESLPTTFYEVQNVDAHILNPRHFQELSSERNMSIVITVGGILRLDDIKNGPLHEFSETFILIPNRAKLMGKGAGMAKRDWLIQNQICRFVVSHDPIETAGWTSMDVDDT